jgi:peptidase E
LLDDAVNVLVCGKFEDSTAASEQLEALEFSDVPVTRLENADSKADVIAMAISKADVVYVL